MVKWVKTSMNPSTKNINNSHIGTLTSNCNHTILLKAYTDRITLI